MTYYNEFDKFAAAWLRELQKAGQISEGQVDERSIKDVQPDDMRGFRRVHFFAGIGGWDYAMRLAGWPADREVWTGSCPCQSFSCAGKGAGVNDPRHLWPDMFRLIKECRPATVFGEQVAAAIGHGWLDGVFADLEGEGYSCGAAVLPACGVGAPHKRDRIFWCASLPVADHHRGGSDSGRRDDGEMRRVSEEERKSEHGTALPGGSGDILPLADSGRASSPGRGVPGHMDGSAGETEGAQEERERVRDAANDGGATYGMGNPAHPDRRAGERGPETGAGPDGERGRGPSGSGLDLRPWSRYSVVLCADGKARRIAPEPEIFPLAYGLPNRVGLLRGSGNAIVPQVAAEFVKAYMSI